MNSQMQLMVSQLEFMSRAGDCAWGGIGNFNPGQDLGIGDNPEDMTIIQKILFDIAENFAQAINQAMSQATASGVGASAAGVGSSAPVNNIVPFRSAQASFDVVNAIAAASNTR